MLDLPTYVAAAQTLGLAAMTVICLHELARCTIMRRDDHEDEDT